MIEIRKFEPDDTDAAVKIWNEVVDDGIAFPQLDELDHESGLAFFEEQTYTGIAVDSDTNEIVGLYILHPNNIGRCGHICNASYAVSSAHRGKQIGEFLVTDCIKRALNLILRFFSLMQLLQVIRQLFTSIQKTWIYPAWHHSKRIFIKRWHL